MNLVSLFASSFFTRAQVDILLRVFARFVTEGSFVPTASTFTNLTVVTPGPMLWQRVGDSVTCYFAAHLEPPAAGVHSYQMTLPVDPGADFVATSDASGNASCSSGQATINAVVGTRQVLLSGAPGSSSPRDWSGSFRYRVTA